MLTQNEKDFLVQIMEDRISYHGMNIPPKLLEQMLERGEKCDGLLDVLSQRLSEEDMQKVMEYTDEVAEASTTESNYFYQKGFEDGLALAKIVYGFESSDMQDVLYNKTIE